MILLFYPSLIYIQSHMKSVIKHNIGNKKENRNALNRIYAANGNQNVASYKISLIIPRSNAFTHAHSSDIETKRITIW